MNIYYDFHIHSALSPCAEDDMTPNNIVNMAKLKGLDAIAVTDHNTIGNVAATMKAGKAVGLLVLPGIEVQTAEEVHVLCLLPNFEAAEKVANIVYENLPDITNRPDIFGNQLIYDNNDNEIGSEEKLLLNSSSLTINQLYKLINEFSGTFIPAHIDRNSYSVLSNLGFFPEEIQATTIELSKNASKHIFNQYKNRYQIITNSDAHNLGDISEPINKIEIFSNTRTNIIKKL